MGRKAQAWSLDFTLSFILFLVALLLAVSLLSRTLLRRDTFPELSQSAEGLSQLAMGEGYPLYWRADDVVRAGLITDGRFSLRKAERLAGLAAERYTGTKRLLGTRFEYAIALSSRDGTIIPFGDRCQIGAAAEVKTLQSERSRIAYFPAGGTLEPSLLAINATSFPSDGLYGMLSGSSSYDLMVFEEPLLSDVAPPYEAEKVVALETFARRGGTILLIGNVSLSGLFSLNLSPVGGGLTAAGAASNDTLLNLSGRNVSAIPASMLALRASGECRYPGGQCRYEALATLPDGRDYAARFAYGDGEVYYLGGLGGTVGAQAFGDYVADRLNVSTLLTMANCTAVTLPFSDARHVVTVQRIVAFKGRPAMLNVSVWEAR